MERSQRRGLWSVLPALLVLLVVVGAPPHRAVRAAEVATEKFKELDPELLFEQGMASRKAGRVYSSIDAFSEILKKHPELSRARLELAVSYYKAMNYDGALAEAQKVLDNPDTPANVRVAILAFVAQVKAAKKKFVMHNEWHFPVMTGLMYDTNVNAGPASRQFGSVRLTSDSVERSDWAFLVNAGIDHTLSTGKTFRAGEQTVNLVWKSMANIFHRQYFNENDQNMLVMTVQSGPAFLSTGHWRGGVDARFDAISYGNKELAQFYSATPYFTWTFGNGLELSADCLVSHHSYKQEIDHDRTSDYLLPKLGFSYAAFGQKLLLAGHVGYFDENANADYKTNDGVTAYGGVSWNLRPNTHLYAGIRYWDYDYDGTEPVANKTRDDDERRYTVGVTHTFKNAGPATDWFVTAYYTYTDYDSSVEYYTFTRNQYVLTLNRRF